MELLGDIFRGLIGMAAMIGFAYLLSSNKKNINWVLVGKGLLLQLFLAFLMLKVPFVRAVFQYIADSFVRLLSFTDEGVKFVFSDMWYTQPQFNTVNVPDATGRMIPADNIIMTDPATGDAKPADSFQIPFMFAFRVLPTVVFFSAFSAMLYYLGILQKIIYAFAWVMSKVMRLSGAESIAAAANVFIGQTEAPLVIKPYLDKMTKSEIMCLMTGGMATIAGGVFALFVIFLGDEFAIHFLIASIVSAPAAIVAAKIMYPEVNEDDINTDLNVPKDKIGVNLLDAISRGTTDGIKLAVNVGAMLIVFIALVAFVNYILSLLGGFTGLNEIIASSTGGNFSSLSLEYILGMLFAPVAWLLGVPAQDITLVGQLLGKKTVVNEVVAYVDLGIFMKDAAINLHPKSVLIATYALCGFANFSSIGIQIGGIGAIAPEQRGTLAQFGLKAMIGGTIACFLTAAIAGMFYNI